MGLLRDALGQLAAERKQRDRALQLQSDLQALVRMAMEEKFYRPTVVQAIPPPQARPTWPADELEDVTSFPIAGDERALEQEVEQLIEEHAAEKGQTPEDWKKDHGVEVKA